MMVLSACEKDHTLNDKFWEEAPLEMEQHQFQIEPELVFSNRRWFPADAVYDHSLDDLLLVAREFGKQRKK